MPQQSRCLTTDTMGPTLLGIVPSVQFSDNLYNFSQSPDRVYDALSRKGFTVNYVEEDFSFLGIPDLDTVAFPMLCFCDIIAEKERIRPHADHYGHYGIGLSKVWGRSVGIQPVHYLIDESPFTKDLKEALELALHLDDGQTTIPLEIISSFLLTTLAYSKPTYGFEHEEEYCFEDECEWRLVPSQLPDNLPVALPRPGEDELDNYRNTVWLPSTLLIRFEYEDITSLFVPDQSAVDEILQVINRLSITSYQKDLLKTKVRTI